MTAAATRRPSPEDRIRAALWFADKGFGIFPVWSADAKGYCRCPKGPACDNAGKHPVTLNGFQDATTDPQRIRTFLGAGSEPNYGMLCPEGVFAWDVDSPDPSDGPVNPDDDGLARLARLEAELGELPPTLRTETANGQHVFLRWPAGLPRPVHKMFGYVTRWGSGRQAGYVIGPRSVHRSGKEYAPVGGTVEIALLPDRWAQAVLDGEQPAVVVGGPRPLPEPGGRHDWLRDRARYYRGFMDDPAVLEAAVMAENARLSQPKTLDEVRRAIGEVMSRFPLDPAEEREDKVQRRLDDSDELDLLGPPASGLFPEPPGAVAFDGLLGELVDDLADGTDASMVGLLGSLVAFCGALVPGQAYFHRLQTSSPFIALVGESSIGRKGTAMTRAHDAMADALTPVTVNRVVLDGVNSGEGLVSALHYKAETFKYEPTVGLLFEEEYASLLASRGRDGSTLDPKMRAAFDGGPLSNRKVGETKTVTPPYWLPALIGITPAELRTRLEPGALLSGSANRWLYLPVQRRERVPSNTLPIFAQEHRRDLVAAAKRAVENRTPLSVHPQVTKMLTEYHDALPRVSFGLAHDLSRRLAVIAFRIALIHATIEQSSDVEPQHLERALALTEYARAGIAWVFGDTIGNPDADLLFRHLQTVGTLRVRTITRNVIRDPIRRQAAIDELLRLGRARVVTVQTGGRTRSELQYVDLRATSVPLVTASFGRNGRSGTSWTEVDRSDKSDQNALPKDGQKSDADPSVTFVHGFANRTDDDETLDKSDKRSPSTHELSVEGLGQKSAKSLPKAGQKVTEVQANVGVRPDGTTWCHFMREHFAQHRDVSAVAWCLICSPQGGAA